MRATDVAQDHYSDRQAFVDGTADIAAQMWAGVDPDNIVESWTAQIPELSTVLAGAQTGAAKAADPYLDEILDAQGLDVADAGYQVAPQAFAGSTVDGGEIAKLLFQPAVQTLLTIGAGASPHDALRSGGYSLDSIARTLVADSGRAADQASLAAHPGADGYTRQLTPPSCSRCAILAGRFYRWNTGFQRHPRCDCVHVPCHRANPLLTNPFHYYESLSARERQAAGWSLADQKAIAEGSDIFQVTNAHRGMSVAGGRKITTEGTTKRGFAGSRLKGRRPRLTPAQIYEDAGDDREAALQGLFDNGYLLKAPVPATRRSLTLAAAETGPGGAAAAGGARTVVEIRKALRDAPTVHDVGTAFLHEAIRITGDPISASFAGSVETAREHAEGLLRGLERFPDANLSRVYVAPLPRSTSYAEATDTGIIVFGSHWSSEAARADYLDALSGDVGSRWHPAGFDTPAAVALHEFGHVIEIATLGQQARREISRVVLEAAQRAGVSADELIATEISRYATRNVAELAGEAFVDVMVNGLAASPLSQDIYGAIRAQYERGGRRRFVPTGRAAKAGPDLPRLTVQELRAMARERGIRIPSGSRKADIVRLLEPASTEPLAGRALRDATRARNREIERRDRVEQVLAQLDEDLAKGASEAVLRQALQAASDMDPRDLAALDRAAGDRTRLRAAITRIGKKNGIVPTARAGQVVKFDEALHQPVADIVIAPGTKVTVVRRGVTVTLPDGTVLTPTRALVRTAAAKTRAAVAPRAVTEFPNRVVATLREFIDAAPTYADYHAMQTIQERYALQEAVRERLAPGINGRYAGLDAKVTEVTYERTFLAVRGKIIDPDTGRTIGKFTRHLSRENDGEIVAHHDLLQIGRTYQGSGFAEKFNANLYDWYRRSGIAKVEVHANIDVGGYTWATQGFDFANAQHAASFLRAAREKVDKVLLRPPKGLTKAQVAQLNDYLREIESGARPASAPEIARFGRQPGQGGRTSVWPGKWLMLRSDWNGRLFL